jgi:hypothetical protein
MTNPFLSNSSLMKAHFFKNMSRLAQIQLPDISYRTRQSMLWDAMNHFELWAIRLQLMDNEDSGA